MNLGTIWLGIRGDTKPAQKDIDKLKRKATQSAKDIEQKTTRSLSTMTKYWKLYAVAAVAALGIVSRSFIKAASTAENYMVRLKILLRSTEEGNRLFKAMADFASKVSFQYEEIMGGATALAGVMKGGVDEIKRWMPMIADLAAAAGMGIQDTIGQVIRMYSAGAASADMFRERGILAMLGFQAGAKYSAEETRKMMFEAWESTTSKFRGAAKELAKTWSGLMSMLADKWFQFRTLVMDAGVYDALKEALTDINKKFAEWIKNNREMIAQDVPKYVDKIRAAVEGIVKIYNALPAVAIGAGLVMAIIFKSSAQLALLVAGITYITTHLDDLRWTLNEMARMGTLGVVPKVIPSYEDVKKAGEQLKGLWGTLSGGKKAIDGTAASVIAVDKAIAKATEKIEALIAKQTELNKKYMDSEIGARAWTIGLRILNTQIMDQEKKIAAYVKVLRDWAKGVPDVPKGPEGPKAPMLPEVKEFIRQWEIQIRDLPAIPKKYWADEAAEFIRQYNVAIRDLSPIPREYWAAEAAEFIRQYNVAIRDLPSPDIKLKGVIELTGIQKLQSWINSFIGVGKVWLKQVTKGGKIWYEQVEASTLKLKIGFLSAALSLMASFVSFADWITAIVAFVRGFLGITERIVKELGSLFEDLPGLITKFFDYLGKIFSQLIPLIIKQLPQIMEAIFDGIASFIEQFISSLPMIIEAIIEMIPKLIKAFIVGYINMWIRIFQCILRLWEWIFDKIWEWILGILTWIDDTWLGGFLGDWWEVMREGIGPWWEEVKEGIGDWWEEIKTGVGGFWETIKEGVGNFWEKFKEGIGDFWEKIKEGVGGFWEKIKEGAASIWDWITGTARDIWYWVLDTTRDVWDWINTPVKSIWDFISGGGGGGGDDGWIPGIPDPGDWFHQGGVVPRAHAGILARDEVPIIAQTGERVLSREQNRAFEAGAMGEQQGGDRTVILEVDGAELGRATFGRLEFDGEAVERVRGVI